MECPTTGRITYPKAIGKGLKDYRHLYRITGESGGGLDMSLAIGSDLLHGAR